MKGCRILMTCALVGVVSAGDRWVWGSSRPGGKAQARQFSGFVPTTPEPPVTTFRPSRAFFQNGLPNHPAFFPAGFLPFDYLPSDVPRINIDGTTKSRVVADTAILDTSSGASLTANDKYTTLDRLQRERGPAPAFPPPKPHQLGGLHADEVFYADDNLLIIKGGGFNSHTFQEPLQPLDEGENIEETTRVTSALPPPSSDEEYNGNIPAIVPPPNSVNERITELVPQRVQPSPFSIFVGGSTNSNYILVPFVENQSLYGNKKTKGTGDITHNHLSTASSKLRREASSVISYVYPTPANIQLTPANSQLTPANTQLLHQTYRRPNTGQHHGTHQHHRVSQNHRMPQNHRVSQNHRVVPFQTSAHLQRVVLPQSSTHQGGVVQQVPLVHHQRIVNQQPSSHQQRFVQRRPAVHQQTVVRQPVTYREPLFQHKPVAHQQSQIPNHFRAPTHPVIQNDHSVTEPFHTQDYAELEFQTEVAFRKPVFSLEGDTDVNYLPPLPGPNPDAEIIQPQSYGTRFTHTPRRTQRPLI